MNISTTESPVKSANSINNDISLNDLRELMCSPIYGFREVPIINTVSYDPILSIEKYIPIVLENGMNSVRSSITIHIDAISMTHFAYSVETIRIIVHKNHMLTLDKFAKPLRFCGECSTENLQYDIVPSNEKLINRISNTLYFTHIAYIAMRKRLSVYGTIREV